MAKHARQAGAVIAPGYGGSGEQPIVVAMARRLDALGIVTRRVTFSRSRPGADLGREMEDVRQVREELAGAIGGGGDAGPAIALVGRSFGGRVCTRLAVIEPPRALVLLGHPISPPRRPRPLDEAALEAVSCPTLVVQGEKDALGPLAILERIAKVNRQVQLFVLPGVGHQFGARQHEGLDHAAAWLTEVLGR